MNIKIAFIFIFVLHLVSQTTAFRTRNPNFYHEIDFSNYPNKSEDELANGYDLDWVRTDREHVYSCQGLWVKRQEHFLRLLPKSEHFMATYIYVRPSSRRLIKELVTYEVQMPTSTGMLEFTYSQDKQTKLSVFILRKNENPKRELIWEQVGPTNGVMSARVHLDELNDQFNLAFGAEVEATYQYSTRTYLSQVILDRVVLIA